MTTEVLIGDSVSPKGPRRSLWTPGDIRRCSSINNARQCRGIAATMTAPDNWISGEHRYWRIRRDIGEDGTARPVYLLGDNSGILNRYRRKSCLMVSSTLFLPIIAHQFRGRFHPPLADTSIRYLGLLRLKLQQWDIARYTVMSWNICG